MTADSAHGPKSPRHEPSKLEAREPLRERLDYLGWGPNDERYVREVAPRLQKDLDAWVERFYAHLMSFPRTAAFLQNPEQVARLKLKQRDHFLSLIQARFDESFMAGRRRVGLAHATENIDPEIFLGAYRLYVDYCLETIAQDADNPLADELARASSVMKAIFLDIGLTLESYFLESSRQVQSALSLLWRANNELRRFAQLTSHDLKTPLATVANFCDEVLDEFGEAIPDEARALVYSARQTLYRLSSLIDELLEATIAPHSPDAIDPVSSREALLEAVERVRPVLHQKSIELVLPEHLPLVWSNKVRLREAFYNVLANAAKFIHQDPGRIRVEVSDNDREAVFAFIDNGPGIPPEELQRVFAPFHRSSMHRDRPGTGLGLYFTKSIVEETGGHVWAESQLGRGTTIFLAIPRRPPQRDRAGNREPASE